MSSRVLVLARGLRLERWMEKSQRKKEKPRNKGVKSEGCLSSRPLCTGVMGMDLGQSREWGEVWRDCEALGNLVLPETLPPSQTSEKLLW